METNVNLAASIGGHENSPLHKKTRFKLEPAHLVKGDF